MNTLTSLKKIAQEKGLILLPRKEYEALLELKKIKEFSPTAAQKKALSRAEDNFQKNKTLSYNEFAKKLGIAN